MRSIILFVPDFIKSGTKRIIIVAFWQKRYEKNYYWPHFDGDLVWWNRNADNNFSFRTCSLFQTLGHNPPVIRPFLITHTDYEKTEFCNPKNEKINPYDARITEIIFVIVFSWSSITKKRSILRDRSITKITITKNVEYLSYQSYRSHKLFS